MAQPDSLSPSRAVDRFSAPSSTPSHLAPPKTRIKPGLRPRSRRKGLVPFLRQVAVIVAGLALLTLAEPRPQTFVAGALVCALGCALRVWSFGHLHKDAELTTSGPYAHSRHPAYLGSLLCMLGVGLAAGNLETLRGQLGYAWLLLLVVVFFGIYLPRKFDRETGRMVEMFGPSMERWSANVPRFLPRLSAWEGAEQRAFSWRQVVANREWPWPLGFAALFVALASVEAWSPF